MKVGFASRPRTGSKVNGDVFIAREYDSKVFLALIDGLGHGEHAALASQTCARIVEEHLEKDITTIFQECDAGLRKTSGVVMSIVLIDTKEGTMTYGGVGNIGSRFIGGKPIHLIPREGIVGYNLPKIKVHRFPYRKEEMILLYSDGVSSKILSHPSSELKGRNTQDIAEEMLNLYGKNEDDATVAVAC